MTRYIIRKFAEAIVTLLGLSLVVFSAVHMTGDPARMLLPVRIDASEEIYEQLKEELGLNRPFMVQYLDFMRKLLTKGDFGRSVRSQKEARHLLFERIPATIQLAAAGPVPVVHHRSSCGYSVRCETGYDRGQDW